MDIIKESFQRVKSDIDYLKVQLQHLTDEITQIKELLSQSKETNPHPSNQLIQQTNQHETPTLNLTEIKKKAPEALKSPKTECSTGNEGVPTNKPTNKPTNQHTGNEGVEIKTNFIPTQKKKESPIYDEISHLAKVSEILASLDGLKKEVRIKFKRLTEQEMAVFTALYELDEIGLEVTYEIIASKLNLTEIS